MKIKIYFLLFTSLLFISALKAQTTTLGNITLNQNQQFSHDSTTCSSQGQMSYTITIAHANLGDSLKIVNTTYATLIDTATNYMGQNPWIINFQLPGAYYSSDRTMNNTPGTAYMPGDFTKIILMQVDSTQNSSDTMHNINNDVMGFVSNPCQYQTVSGKIYIDRNNNCVFDGTDIPLQAVAASGIDSLASPSAYPTENLYGYTDMTGVYSILAQQTYMTDYTIQIPAYYQFIFPSTSCSPASYSYTTLPQTTADFSLQCTSNIDVQCYALSANVAHPNKPFFVYPYVSNTGCDSASGQLKLILDSRVIYNSGLSSNPATTVSGDTLIWNYVNLTSLSNGSYWNSFAAGVHLTPNTSVHVGDTLCFRVMTNVPTNDIDATNNDYTVCIPVTTAYDPNVKEVSPKGLGPAGNIPVTTNVLTYMIHFQNTGTAAATNISVIDTLNSNIIPSSLKILGATHNVTPEWLAPGIVRFNFFNINLADSSSNEAASHGAIRFSVKLNQGLLLGTKIKNRADIYFDFNAPVATNTAVNTIASVTGVQELSNVTGTIKVYPNPFSTNTTFVIQSDKGNETYLFELFDVVGKKVKSIQVSAKEFQVSRDELENGVYFYKIHSAENTIGVGKLIIQ